MEPTLGPTGRVYSATYLQPTTLLQNVHLILTSPDCLNIKSSNLGQNFFLYMVPTKNIKFSSAFSTIKLKHPVL